MSSLKATGLTVRCICQEPVEVRCSSILRSIICSSNGMTCLHFLSMILSTSASWSSRKSRYSDTSLRAAFCFSVCSIFVGDGCRWSFLQRYCKKGAGRLIKSSKKRLVICYFLPKPKKRGLFFDNLRFLAMMNVNGGGVPWSCHGDRSVASVCRCRCPVLWHAGTDTFWQVWLPSLTCRGGARGGVVTHCPLAVFSEFLALFPNHPKSFLVLEFTEKVNFLKSCKNTF